MFSPYLGKLYSENDVKHAIESFQNEITFEVCKDKYLAAAEALVQQKIIGWFQGRSECGPRSLGSRSILADPRNPDMKDIINARVKFRESFRPFAPSILYEEQSKYFDLDIPSPYMLMIAKIYPEKQKIIPAVTHVDGTGRLQSVQKEINEEYYMLIKTFCQITGVPVVLNTSFNINGEPIVETPGDAIKCYLSSDFDELFIHNYKITKRRV